MTYFIFRRRSVSPTSDSSTAASTTLLSRKQSSHATSLFSMAALMRPSVSASSTDIHGTKRFMEPLMPKEHLNILPMNIGSSSSGDIIPVSTGLLGKDPSTISGAANTLGNVAGGILAGLQCPSVMGSSLHNVFK